jgi:hypothetical protein
MRWLTVEQRLLVTARDHGHTGPRKRRFDVAKIQELLGRSEPESVAVTGSHSNEGAESEPVIASPEPVMVLGLAAHKQRSLNGVSGDTVTPGVLSHQATDSEQDVAGGGSESDLDAEAVEKVLHLLPRNERAWSVLRTSDDCRWSLEVDRVVVEFKYSYHEGLVRPLLADLADAVEKVLGRDVELRRRQSNTKEA